MSAWVRIHWHDSTPRVSGARHGRGTDFAFLAKPVEPSVLVATVREVIGRAQA